MAKLVDAGRFTVIQCSDKEIRNATGSRAVYCDFCGHAAHGVVGYYIAVLNQWICPQCYREWISRAIYYPEDADIERKNFDFYAPRLGLKCQ